MLIISYKMTPMESNPEPPESIEDAAMAIFSEVHSELDMKVEALPGPDMEDSNELNIKIEGNK